MKMDEIKTPVDAPDKKEAFVTYMKGLFPAADVAAIDAAWVKHSSMTLTERITLMMKQYGDTLVTDLQARFAAQVAEQAKVQEKAIVEGVMQGLGISKDKPVTMGELETYVRKVALEVMPPEKKTQIGSVDSKGENLGAAPKVIDFNKRLQDDIAKRGVV